jgi:hypothetical protein
MDARRAHAGPSAPAAYAERALAGAGAPGSAKRVHEAALASAAAEQLVKGGKTDLLLRFFDSEFFDEWIAVSYLWRTKAEVRSVTSRWPAFETALISPALLTPRACATISATECTR